MYLSTTGGIEVVSLGDITLGELTSLQAGNHDINVNISNYDLVEGTLACALYKGNELAYIIIKNGGFDGTVKLAKNYAISADITKIKVMFLTHLDSLIPICDFSQITK